jgi:Ca2+-binding RTX toxin-like protein
MDLYDNSSSQVQQTLASQVSPAVVNAVLAAIGGKSSFLIDDEAANQNLVVAPGVDLVVSKNPVVAAYLPTLTPDPNGAIHPSFDSATFVANPNVAPVTILSEGSNFFELTSGSETVIGGDSPTFVVDASHNTSDVKLEAGSGYSFLIGGSGNDTLTGSTSSTGTAIMVAGSGPTTIQGGAGHDSLYGGGKSDLIGGIGSGQNLLGGFSPTAADTLTAGTGGHETLAVSMGNNLLDDTLGDGTDTLFSGTGSDTLKSGANGGLFDLKGNSDVLGGSGNDTVFVEKGSAGSPLHESIDGGGGTNFVTFNGYGHGDATVTVAGNVTTVTFASTGQTATLTNVTAIFFGNDTVPHA